MAQAQTGLYWHGICTSGIMKLTPSSPALLIVMHGPGRGRDVPTLACLLEYTRASFPEFHANIRVHQTGSPPPSLNGVGLVLFWMGDPLEQMYPDCFREAMDIHRAAKAAGLPVFNPPAALSHTAKSAQGQTWKAAGIACAQVQVCESQIALNETARRFGFPCLLRNDVGHAQQGMEVLQSPQDLAGALERAAPTPAISEIKDIRAAYREAGGKGLNRVFHHKARAFVLDGKVKACHLFHGKDLIVSSGLSLFAREERPKRQFARKFGFHRNLLKRLVAADRAYFDMPVAHADEIVRAVQLLGLDFAAVDYSILPDGTPFFWEANPYFYLPHGRESVMSEARGAIGRVEETYAWFAEGLSEALHREATRDKTRPEAS